MLICLLTLSIETLPTCTFIKHLVIKECYQCISRINFIQKLWNRVLKILRIKSNIQKLSISLLISFQSFNVEFQLSIKTEMGASKDPICCRISYFCFSHVFRISYPSVQSGGISVLSAKLFTKKITTKE